MIGAATQITTFVAAAMRETTTPQLQSAWYQGQFAPMADLGAALGLLVALIAFASAAIRRSPEALAAAIAGIVRAGIGTGLVVALTVIGLSLADQISAAVLSGSAHAFWTTVAHAWGHSGFGGFGSSALATLIALVEVFAALFVWLELIVRNAAIYVAVLFFPVALAAAIWPPLSAWPGRLARLLLLFVILKPVALVVLSLAGNAAAAGLSFGGGVPGSVGTILAATVIYGLAAFAPWALMHLLAADSESAHAAAGLRTAGVAAVQRGRSSISGGGDTPGPARAGPLGGARPPGGGDGPGAPRGGGGGSGAGPTGSGPSGGGQSGAGGRAQPPQETLPLGASAIGQGNVGAAAGVAGMALAARGGGSDPRPGAQEVGDDPPQSGASPSPTPPTLRLVPAEPPADPDDDGAA